MLTVKYKTMLRGLYVVCCIEFEADEIQTVGVVVSFYSTGRKNTFCTIT